MVLTNQRPDPIDLRLEDVWIADCGARYVGDPAPHQPLALLIVLDLPESPFPAAGLNEEIAMIGFRRNWENLLRSKGIAIQGMV